jgi:ubiquinone/menaquinone biosynthesis C-methylase UbiE
MQLTGPELQNKEAFAREEALKEYSQFYLLPVEERIFAEHFTHPGRVLDVGCGCGRTSVFLRNMGHTVTGIDIVPEMLDIARKWVKGVEFRLMNACELEFGSDSFDYVLFSYNGIDCIHPDTKRNMCLEEICRALKPGRLFVFSTHNFMSLRTFVPTNRYRLDNLFLNLKNKRLFPRYRLEKHPSGILELYFATPFQQKRELREIGFKTIEVYGQKSDHPVFTTLFDTWSYYVCRKARL